MPGSNRLRRRALGLRGRRARHANGAGDTQPVNAHPAIAVSARINRDPLRAYNRVELLRDGVPIRRQEGRELLHPVDRPGVYRIEVSLWVVDRWLPWIFSNPIYVRA